MNYLFRFISYHLRGMTIPCMEARLELFPADADATGWRHIWISFKTLTSVL